MSLGSDERKHLADLANRAYPIVEQAIEAYTKTSGMPRRFGIGVYDASDGGSGLDPATLPGRAIADFRIDPHDWGDRDYITNVRRKLTVAIRTGRDTADVVKNAPELFREDDMKAPGGVIGEVGGKAVGVGASGYRGPEDAVFASLLLEAMKRLNGDYEQQASRPAG